MNILSQTLSRRNCRNRIAAALLALVPALSTGIANQDIRAESPPDALAATHETTNPSGRDRAELDRLIRQWRSVVARLSKLDVQYRLYGTRNDPEIGRQFDELLAQGQELQTQLIDAAMTAYVKRPRDNMDLINFLGSVATMEATSENYEFAARIIQKMIDSGLEAKSLYRLAVPTAFNCNDFETAEKYLTLGQKKNLDLGGIDAEQFRGEIAYYRAAWAVERRLREAELRADDLPRVKLRTNKGEIELELFENEAPNTVANFITLAEKGFYDGLTFFRVTAGGTAQAGCPVGDGTGGPGYRIVSEALKDNRRGHFRGTLSMDSTSPDLGGSQFSLCLVPSGDRDGVHTAFGRVIRGLDVLSKLQRRTPRDPKSVAMNPHANVVIPPADRILSATVVRKRPHPYRPDTIPDPPPSATAERPKSS